MDVVAVRHFRSLGKVLPSASAFGRSFRRSTLIKRSINRPSYLAQPIRVEAWQPPEEADDYAVPDHRYRTGLPLSLDTRRNHPDRHVTERFVTDRESVREVGGQRVWVVGGDAA
jgi:hypothetical protein